MQQKRLHTNKFCVSFNLQPSLWEGGGGRERGDFNRKNLIQKLYSVLPWRHLQIKGDGLKPACHQTLEKQNKINKISIPTNPNRSYEEKIIQTDIWPKYTWIPLA